MYKYLEEEDRFETFTPPYDFSSINVEVAARPVKDRHGNILLNSGSGIDYGQKTTEGVYQFDPQAFNLGPLVQNTQICALLYERDAGSDQGLPLVPG